MDIRLDHVAINSANFEETVRFFQTVFHMTVLKDAGIKPHRQLWFCEGIQIIESTESCRENTMYHHIALRVSDKDAIIDAAKAHGCTLFGGKANWLVTGDGIVIELMG